MRGPSSRRPEAPGTAGLPSAPGAGHPLSRGARAPALPANPPSASCRVGCWDPAPGVGAGVRREAQATAGKGRGVLGAGGTEGRGPGAHPLPPGPIPIPASRGCGCYGGGGRAVRGSQAAPAPGRGEGGCGLPGGLWAPRPTGRPPPTAVTPWSRAVPRAGAPRQPGGCSPHPWRQDASFPPQHGATQKVPRERLTSSQPGLSQGQAPTRRNEKSGQVPLLLPRKVPAKSRSLPTFS